MGNESVEDHVLIIPMGTSDSGIGEYAQAQLSVSMGRMSPWGVQLQVWDRIGMLVMQRSVTYR